MKNVMLGKTTLILKGESKNPPTDEVVKDYTSMLVLGKAQTGNAFLATAIQNSLDDCSLVMELKDAHLFLFQPIARAIM